MTHNEFVLDIIRSTDREGRLFRRERQDLEYKESFGEKSWPKYAKTMAAFANNQGGYILFGVKDTPRELVGIDDIFNNFKQEKFTEYLNDLFSPELLWESGIVDFDNKVVGYIYTAEADTKPVIATKNENSVKITNGDVYYRYRGRSEKIKFSEMHRIVEERAKNERERILKLVEIIRKNDTPNLGIINYDKGSFSTPFGVDIAIEKKLIFQVLRKAKYIKEGSFNETSGTPVLKVTGNIDLAEEVPVPDIEPNVKYPYIQKQIAELLKISNQEVYALVWEYKCKGQKKFHVEVTTSKINKFHKFSDMAVQYLAEQINDNKDNPEWLKTIKDEFNQRNHA